MKTLTCIAALFISTIFYGCQKSNPAATNDELKDKETLQGLLLPSVQVIRNKANWAIAGANLDQSRITLTSGEYNNIHKTIGSPDIRIFIDGDVVKEGRSLPYTKLLDGKSRLVYYYEWSGKDIILYRQYTGSPERKGEIELLSVGWGHANVYPDFPDDMKAEERKRLMALLLPAVQHVREAGPKNFEPGPDGVLTCEATLTREESGNIGEAVGKPDIRIFLKGDTEKSGRSLPYTRTLPGSSIRTVYYHEWLGDKLIVRYQSTGSPTAGSAPIEEMSLNFEKIK